VYVCVEHTSCSLEIGPDEMRNAFAALMLIELKAVAAAVVVVVVVDDDEYVRHDDDDDEFQLC